MKKSKFLSTTDVAKLLGVHRTTIFKKIKSGKIKAVKIGHDFIIDKKELGGISKGKLRKKDKVEIDKAVKKAVEDYGETLKMLGTT